jgi:preprotein translocase subunit SecA
LYIQPIVQRTNHCLNNIDKNQIIVSTNLAGRGTDINTTDAVENQGGLHAIITFLPRNKRVQDQAYGRSARKGK